MREIPFDPANDDIMERLKSVPVFDSLPESHIREAMRAASIRRYEAGETIIEEGEFDNQVFFLIFGHLKITVHGTEVGQLKRLGDVFGEMGIIDGSPRSATITTEKTSLVISLDDAAIGSLGEASKIFTQAVMYRVFAEVLAIRLRKANQKISEMQDELNALKET
ncbi:cyclic nucleotide-binding domain-containing protein [uncultured Pseudodesulfovibrio sp.]|uniref:Crp/Fnr family transcriptional regulator n=1 Tax=uncultured Pseudodesulfovibrio sp. TaxID=2035858 RepID=UPI0029C603E3|nr:cyclic nucleotide-binding domain-containing protein [uncultured Pseudodesulfovibrio sp.]